MVKGIPGSLRLLDFSVSLHDSFSVARDLSALMSALAAFLESIFNVSSSFEVTLSFELEQTANADSVL